MSQNTSSAVMQQRSEPHDSLDDFPTPPWAARALCEHVISTDPRRDTVLEPAANRGYMVKGLTDYFKTVHASDIHDYGAGFPARDFLFPGPLPEVDWVITNPPFRLAEQFIMRGLEVANAGVAVIVRSAFVEGVGRYDRLFSKTPPNLIVQFVERVPMVRGRYDPNASTATSYCWLVWFRSGALNVGFEWIPPCRKQLEREEDYDITA